MTSHARYLELLHATGGRRIGVIGDIMLDRSVFGVVDRLSSEAPIPILDVSRECEHLGGAANVVNNLCAMGDRPVLFSVVGDDGNGLLLRTLLGEHEGIETVILADPSRPTTVKLRLFAQNRHIARADFESRAPVDQRLWRELAAAFETAAPGLAAVVVQDYNKGLLTAEFIAELLRIARQHRVMVLVDPKFENFFAYRGATVFKPNLREAAEALAVRLQDRASIERAAAELRSRVDAENLVLTLGKDGVILAGADGRCTRWPAFVRVVSDPAGAGDTVISIMASVMAAGGTAAEAVVLANCGAGVICEKVGVQPVARDDLEDAVRRHTDAGPTDHATGPSGSSS
ncbi:MAG: bifunctional ADP-heptose synthase [Alphaproteobacteria bacterium]|nr:bifunctional ADP-heptose synthase [Alphaproteobacteria bacterium]